MMTQDASSYCLVMVTVASEAEGKKIATALLTEKLAACINITPINSFYTWSETIHHDQEWQLFIKTRFNLFSELAEKIKLLHSYDIPEIIALPMIAGSLSYLNWIDESTKPG
ncbi:MAG: divalent-cation tolerance protein CutA [Xenococcaceae cyanobacterium MO_188.B19]|nr:divalent-cation tolerance protein CutA [Xenococcaceae cyanobacterium MO_188.B19]